MILHEVIMIRALGQIAYFLDFQKEYFYILMIFYTGGCLIIIVSN